MEWFIIRLLATSIVAFFLATVPAAANDKDTPNKWFKDYEVEYLKAYEKAYDDGHDVGRNIVDDGLESGGEASKSRVVESTARLQSWTEPVVYEETSYTEEVPATTSYSGGVGNSTVQCESGGDYGANTGNGYYGGYQFDSGTWDAYGDPAYGEANEAPPAVQDAAAASVPYDAWPNC